MIRPLHMILSGKTPGDITAPIVAELENFTRSKEAEAAVLTTKANEEMIAAQARFAEQNKLADAAMQESIKAARIADNLRKVAM